MVRMRFSDFGVCTTRPLAGDGPETLSGDLIVLTEADVWSAPGKYALIPVGNVSAKNYTVTLAPGVLTVLPASSSNMIPRVLQNGYFAALVDFYRTVLTDGSGGASDSAQDDEDDAAAISSDKLPTGDSRLAEALILTRATQPFYIAHGR